MRQLNRWSREALAGVVRGRIALPATLLVLALLWMPMPSPAETRAFRLNSRAGFLAGTLEGIGVDELGTLRLADRVERLAEVDEPFLLSAVAHPDGWVVGTGNAGRILKVDRSGEIATLHSAAEPEITAEILIRLFCLLLYRYSSYVSSPNSSRRLISCLLMSAISS